MTIDDVSLFYNPEFVETLNAAELAGVLVHESCTGTSAPHTSR
ncbi:hypothetical protein [Alloacidobacterium dinghuense]|nr:hypothetical protein [Alloacidobacterium dinghuense]